MSEFVLAVGARLLNQISDLCTTVGSHITVSCIQGEIFLASINPEYFKLYKTEQKTDIADFTIRIPKTFIHPLISEVCAIHFNISDKITMTKLKNAEVVARVSFRLELDFNDSFIKETVTLGNVTDDYYDLSPLAELRSLVPYSKSGIQFKDNLAYIHSLGFIVYRELEHSLNFILTQKNIAELVKFVKAYGKVHLFESGNYLIFKHDESYFGCRQPAAFIDSNYENYCRAKPLARTTCSLADLCHILKSFSIPKKDAPLAAFDLAHNYIEISLNAECSYYIQLKTETPVNMNFKLSVEVLKQIFSNSAIDYNHAELIVYDYFVVFKFGKVHILTHRYDEGLL